MSGEIDGHDSLAAGQEIRELAGDGGHEGRLLESQLFGEAHLTDSAATLAPMVKVDTPADSITEMFTVSLSPRRKSLEGSGARRSHPGTALKPWAWSPLV